MAAGCAALGPLSAYQALDGASDFHYTLIVAFILFLHKELSQTWL